MTKFDVGEIFAALTAKGLTQREIADAIGVTQSAVSNIKSGRRRLQIEEAIALISLAKADQNEPKYRVIRAPMVDIKDGEPWWQPTSQLGAVLVPDDFDENRKVMIANGEEARLTVQRFRKFRLTYEPGVFDLADNAGYVLLVNGAVQLVTFRTNPSRFENFWDPTWDGGPRAVGEFPFQILGKILTVSAG